MKMKGLLKVTAAAISLLSFATIFSACGYAVSDCTAEQWYDIILKDKPIVVNEGGKYTLHVGDVRIPYSAKPYAHSHTPKLMLKCGEVLRTAQFVAYENTMPTSDCYDEVCDCIKNSLLDLN